MPEPNPKKRNPVNPIIAAELPTKLKHGIARPDRRPSCLRCAMLFNGAFSLQSTHSAVLSDEQREWRLA